MSTSLRRLFLCRSCHAKNSGFLHCVFAATPMMRIRLMTLSTSQMPVSFGNEHVRKKVS